MAKLQKNLHKKSKLTKELSSVLKDVRGNPTFGSSSKDEDKNS